MALKVTRSFAGRKPDKERVLTLPLKGIYFDQIKSGEKEYEFREVTPYWKKRLENREYDKIVLTRGYPKRDDAERRIERPWRGYEITRILHEHFGSNWAFVFAIKVN